MEQMFFLGDFNVRIHDQGVGEDLIVEPYVFVYSCAAYDAFLNRSMLFGLCIEFSSFLTNSWFEPGKDGVVTIVISELSRRRKLYDIKILLNLTS